ncbi:hypothetical protein DH2020_029389 [Rehmannia glutinosa]|uniref:TF-B3 domain-containing protein n=1 Tax=Rehmannia glutinosa TaxID=99300 RepID=A0ABR0VNP3_REHGL
MVVAKKSAYEASRQKRLEENKKRMEELNLNKLAQAMHTPKPSPMKKVKPKVPKQPLDLSAVRRSSRVADLPPRTYKEGLPVQFCKTHLPSRDVMVNLVDEKGDEFETKYLAQKTGLSGGWRGFAIDHELVDGDALIFQLIKPTTFKVYIIRVNEPGDTSN